MASKTISSVVTAAAKHFFEVEIHWKMACDFTPEPSSSMKFIHLYLNSHADLLSKKFIFFTQNNQNTHWWGWAAINPWYHIVKAFQNKQDEKESSNNKSATNEDKYVSGLLVRNGMPSKDKLVEKRGKKDSLIFVWF